MIPWFFIIIVSGTIFFQVKLKLSERKFDTRADRLDYLREDAEANYSRTRPLEEELYIRLGEEDFPFYDEYDQSNEKEKELIDIQQMVRHHLSAPLIKTIDEKNIELKKKYGKKNLEQIIYGEENYTKLLQYANKWAKLLMDAGNYRDAELILEKLANNRSDLSQTYILLYNLYREKDYKDKLNKLAAKLDELPEVTRNIILKNIEHGDTI